MAKVLCFGSLNIDYVYKVDHFVRTGETLASSDLKVYSGGKGLNQSCALGKAGCSVFHAGAIGKDGEFLLDILNESGVNTELVSVSEDVRTGNAIIQNDDAGDNCILLYGGANRTVTEEYADSVLAHFTEGDYIVLQNEISCLDYIITKAHERGLVTVLNPSPVNSAVTEHVLGMADWLLLNEIEAGVLTGAGAADEAGLAADEEKLAAALRTTFPNAKIVLTMGGNGSCFIGPDRLCHQDIFPVKAVDTTAAGDTFTGYFIAELIAGQDVQKCLETASKASSIAVSRPGAAPSIPWRREV